MASLQTSKRHLLINHPRLHAAWLVTLATLGGLSLLAIPVVSAAACGSAIWMLFQAQTPVQWLFTEALGGLGFIGILCSIDLLLVRVPKPAGQLLSPADSPDLFATVKRCARHYRLNGVDRIVLGDKPELRLIFHTGCGYPLGAACTLYLGAPLLCLLESNQFQIALRATMGQWSRKHNRVGSFICRQVAFWNALRDQYRQRRFPAGWLLRGPIKAFANSLERQAREIRQAQAFVHDHIAQTLSDETQTLEILAAQAVSSAYVDAKFWPWIMGAAARSPEPVVKPFTNFLPVMQSMLTREDASRWLLQALAAPATPVAAGLRERLAVLGQSEIHWAGLPQQPAVTVLFGQKWGSLAARLDDQWRLGIGREWQERHEQFQRESRDFYALKVKAKCEPVTGSEAVRYLRLAEKFLKPQDLTKLCIKLLSENRIWPDVCFQCGRLLLTADDEAGIRALELAMQLDQGYVNAASAMIASFERRNRVLSFRRIAVAS